MDGRETVVCSWTCLLHVVGACRTDVYHDKGSDVPIVGGRVLAAGVRHDVDVHEALALAHGLAVCGEGLREVSAFIAGP